MVDEEKGILVDNKTRTVRIVGDKILFTLKRDGITDYYSNHPELAKILVMDCIHPYRHEGRLKVRVADNNGEQLNCYSYLIALGCYMGRVKADTFMSDTIRLKTECMSNSMTVDHADNIVVNNTRYNLSLMSATMNKQKGDIVSRFKTPSAIAVAYVDGKYRICIANYATEIEFILKIVERIQQHTGRRILGHATPTLKRKYICDTPKKFCDTLQGLSKTVLEGTSPIRDQNGKWLYQDKEAYYMDVQNSMEAQTEIAMKDEKEFGVFVIQPV